MKFKIGPVYFTWSDYKQFINAGKKKKMLHL